MSWLPALSVAAALLAAPAPVPDPNVGDGGVGGFYLWTRPIPAEPGRLLRQAPMANPVPAAASARRMLYSSRSGFGPEHPITVSGSIYLPKGKAPKGGWPVIAWAHGTTGTADVCAPSFMGWSPRDTRYLDGWLSAGYAVVATDYEGLGAPGPHPYMAVRSAAYSVLDSVRAARAAERSLSNRTVVVGQSQGAHAALSTALLADRYAPGIDLRGVVATGVPGEVGFAPEDDGAPSSIKRAAPLADDVPRQGVRGLSPSQFDGWMVVYMAYFASYPAVDPGFKASEYLTAKGLQAFERLKHECHGAVLPALLKDKPTLSSLFLKDPTPLERALVHERQYPDLAFKAPLFIGIGLQDEQTAPERSFNIARAACGRGSNVTVRFYPGQSHSGAVMPSQTDSLPFVRQVFAGETPKSDCPALAWPGRS